MGNIRLTIFDIFSYIFPGICYLIIFYLYFINQNITTLYPIILNLKFNSSVVFLFIAYLVGFIMDSISGRIIPYITDMFQRDFKDRVLDELSLKHVKEDVISRMKTSQKQR